jgi:hypothetical protein
MHAPKAPNIPAPTPAPPPPTIDQAVEASKQDQLLRQRRGAAASVLAGQAGATAQQSMQMGGVAKLLGG